jgi:hypothetical protein
LKGKIKAANSDRDQCSLSDLVKPGLDAIKKEHRKHFLSNGSNKLLDFRSLEVDVAFLKRGLPADKNANRWDYVVWSAKNKFACFVEPHSASTGEVDVVLRKFAWLNAKLTSEEFRGCFLGYQKQFIWAFSASNRISPNSPQRRNLAKSSLVILGQNEVIDLASKTVKKRS